MTFGYEVDGVHFLGWVDAKSEDDFLDKPAALKSKWDSTEDKFRRVHPSCCPKWRMESNGWLQVP